VLTGGQSLRGQRTFAQNAPVHGHLRTGRLGPNLQLAQRRRGACNLDELRHLSAWRDRDRNRSHIGVRHELNDVTSRLQLNVERRHSALLAVNDDDRARRAGLHGQCAQTFR
jgi:hypothetical protein